MAVAAGLVVSRRRRVEIIVHAGADEVWVVPISGADAFPRHRSEVPIDSHAEAIACGITVRFPVVRCHMVHKIKPELLVPSERLGIAPEPLVRRILAALRLEVQRQAMETRLQFARHGDERCVAMT